MHMYVVDFTMTKADEWECPISEEALVRQANDKCGQTRRKYN